MVAKTLLCLGFYCWGLLLQSALLSCLLSFRFHLWWWCLLPSGIKPRETQTPTNEWIVALGLIDVEPTFLSSNSNVVIERLLSQFISTSFVISTPVIVNKLNKGNVNVRCGVGDHGSHSRPAHDSWMNAKKRSVSYLTPFSLLFPFYPSSD